MPRFEIQEANGTYYRCDGDMSVIAQWLPWALGAAHVAPDWPAQIRVYPMQDAQGRPDWPPAQASHLHQFDSVAQLRDILKEIDS
jgi:hypothetical protein